MPANISVVSVLQEASKAKEGDKGKGGDKDANSKDAKAEDINSGKGKASDTKGNNDKDKAADDTKATEVEMKDADKVCRWSVTALLSHCG